MIKNMGKINNNLIIKLGESKLSPPNSDLGLNKAYMQK